MKTVSRYWGALSLRLKIAIAFALVGIIPVAIAGLVAVRLASTEMEKDAGRRSSRTGRAVAALGVAGCAGVVEARTSARSGAASWICPGCCLCQVPHPSRVRRMPWSVGPDECQWAGGVSMVRDQGARLGVRRMWESPTASVGGWRRPHSRRAGSCVSFYDGPDFRWGEGSRHSTNQASLGYRHPRCRANRRRWVLRRLVARHLGAARTCRYAGQRGSASTVDGRGIARSAG
jgi:hypothetical protein